MVAGLNGDEEVVVNPPDSIASGEKVRVTEHNRSRDSSSAPISDNFPFLGIGCSRFFSLCGLLFFAGCAVGPHYSRPSTPVPPAYKETPENWKLAQPADQVLRGNWWEIYQDPQLNALEEKVDVSNQTLKAAQAQFAEARALVRQYRADYYPSVTAGVSATRNRLSKNRPLLGSTTNYTDLVLPADVSYEADVWGRVRHTVEAARAASPGQRC